MAEDAICEEIRKAAALGEPIEAFRDHTATCPQCAVMTSHVPWPLPEHADAQIPDFDSVLANIEAHSGPLERLRATPARLRMAIMLLVAGLAAAAVVMLHGRMDADAYPPARGALEIVCLGGTAAWAGAAVLRPMFRVARPLVLTTVNILLSFGLPALIATLPQAHTAHAESLGGNAGAFVSGAMQCLIYGASLGAMGGTMLAALRTQGGTGYLDSLEFSAAAGTLGALLLHLHCPDTGTRHLWAGHATVVPAVAVLALAWHRGHRLWTAPRT